MKCEQLTLVAMNDTLQKPLISNGWLRALFFLLFLILMVSLTVWVLDITMKKWLPGEIDSKNPDEQINMLWRSVAASTISSFVSVWFFRKWIDRQSVYSLGFEWKGAKNHAVVGGLAAIGMLGVGTLVLFMTSHLSFNGWNFNGGFLLNSILIMAFVALEEELVFRGYLLNNLMQSTNKWGALLISAILFGAIHLGNPNAGFLPILEIFIAGIMLGINYIFTRNLWFGIALHFVWNFMQGAVLGYQVSGVNMPTLIQQEVTGPHWLTGGSFGFEGSILALILNVALIVLLALLYNRSRNDYQTISS